MKPPFVVQHLQSDRTWTTAVIIKTVNNEQVETPLETRDRMRAFALVGKVWKGPQAAATERFRLVDSANAHVPAPDPVAFATWAWLRGYFIGNIDNSLAYIKAITTFERFVPKPNTLKEAA